MKKKVYEVKNGEVVGYALTYCVDRVSRKVLHHKTDAGGTSSAVNIHRLSFLIEEKDEGSSNSLDRLRPDFKLLAAPSVQCGEFSLSSIKGKHPYGLVFESIFTPALWYKDRKAEIEDLYFTKIKEDNQIGYRIIRDALIMPQGLGENYNPSRPYVNEIILSELVLEDFVVAVTSHMQEIERRGFNGFNKTMIEYLNIDTTKFLNGLVEVELSR